LLLEQKGFDMRRAARLVTVFVCAVVGVAGIGAGAGASETTPSPAVPAVGVTYDVSLGDSLSRGVQPDRAGRDMQTTRGYVDDLFTLEQPLHPNLRLIKLGCPGESTTTLIQGGLCAYPLGSQLAQAEAFLRAHPGQVSFITIDIGGNDVYGCADGGVVRGRCVARGLRTIEQNLPQILAGVRMAVGTGVPIVGASYYNAFLAAWLSGSEGEAFARASDRMVVRLDGVLAAKYGAARSPMASVEDAFATTDFRDFVPLPGFGEVPLNVFDICTWTWMCAPSPRGPNIHANVGGYAQIAAAFAAVVPS
jgi:lysophospholipase L1-like esterase